MYGSSAMMNRNIDAKFHDQNVKKKNFYLHLPDEEVKTVASLNTNIKFFGGNIVDILDEKTDYFVIRKKLYTKLTSIQNVCSQSKIPSRSLSLVQKSIEKTSEKEMNLLQKLKTLRIPIVSCESLKYYLSRDSSKYNLCLPSASNCIPLKEPVIKLEDCEKKFKPEFSEFGLKNIPQLSFFRGYSKSPFDGKNAVKRYFAYPTKDGAQSEENGREKQVKKVAKKIKKKFCEICHVAYDNLSEHTQTETHIKFSSDDSNYKDVDALISKISATSLDNIPSPEESPSPIQEQDIPPSRHVSNTTNCLNISFSSDDSKSFHLQENLDHIFNVINSENNLETQTTPFRNQLFAESPLFSPTVPQNTIDFSLYAPLNIPNDLPALNNDNFGNDPQSSKQSQKFHSDTKSSSDKLNTSNAEISENLSISRYENHLNDVKSSEKSIDYYYHCKPVETDGLRLKFTKVRNANDNFDDRPAKYQRHE